MDAALFNAIVVTNLMHSNLLLFYSVQGHENNLRLHISGFSSCYLRYGIIFHSGKGDRKGKYKLTIL